MKLLLIDDDAFLRDMYVTKFKESGHDVSVATNGTEALQILEEDSFDIILMDMIMPGISGVELIKAVRALASTKDTKCIVLSNQGEQEDINSAQAAGADGYIVKAESIPSQVVTKVETLVR